MMVPKFFDFLHPVLLVLDGRGVLPVAEIRMAVAQKMQLSQEAREQRIPSGQATYASRINWALAFLKKAQLVSNPARGKYELTSLGKTALVEVGDAINLDYLDRFESFRRFRYGVPKDAEVVSTELLNDLVNEDTPEEAIGVAYRRINEGLAEELLGAIMEQSPAFFERLVVALLTKMGYGGAIADAGKVVGKVNDEGIDGVIREDKLGFSKIYIQAKRWDPTRKVGRQEIQTFVGALAGQQGARKGLFITTAQFTKGARDYAEYRTASATVVLVDGQMLAQLMIENELGVSPVKIYTVRRLDNDFFADDAE